MGATTSCSTASEAETQVLGDIARPSPTKSLDFFTEPYTREGEGNVGVQCRRGPEHVPRSDIDPEKTHHGQLHCDNPYP